MKTASLFILAIAAAFAGAGGACAADLRIPYGQPRPVLEEYGSGWYLRGDIGWTGYSSVSADYVGRTGVLGAVSNTKLDDTWVVGAGVGYQAGWFRSDVTVDYRSQSEFAGTALGDVFNGNVASWSTLLNGYFDLGSWSGITPYVGAGVGAAYHYAHNWRDISSGEQYYNGSNWDFAWAVMAGVAVKVSPNMSVDVGYRYVDLGQPESGVGHTLTTDRIRLDSVTAHEVRAGVRYTID
jgi:opacity protein-like surface antigen